MARSCKMTKMHFQLIAETIRSLGVYGPNYQYPVKTMSLKARSDVAREFARALKMTNPAFNIDRFLAACEPIK